MKWLKNLFRPKVIEIKYCRIRKPKKGETILFILPTTNPEVIQRFSDKLKDVQHKNYWVVTEGIEVQHISKKSKVSGRL